MARTTLARMWTKSEQERAKLIADYIASGKSNPMYQGARGIVRGLKLHVQYKGNENYARLKVYDVMPLVAQIVPERYPGYVLAVEPDKEGAVYRITDKSTPRMHRAALARMRQMYAKAQRTLYQALPDDALGKVEIEVAEAVMASMNPDVIAVIEEVLAEEAAKRKKQERAKRKREMKAALTQKAA